jgi:hypothetical protein
LGEKNLDLCSSFVLNQPRPWTDDDDLRFTILMGMRAGFKLVRGLRRALTERDEELIVHEIATRLTASGRKWAYQPGEVAPGLMAKLPDSKKRDET